MRNYNLSKLAVLIVEDNGFMQKLLKEILRTLGVRTIKVATDGADALKELRVFSPDFIIADWKMDPIDGIEFIKMLRTAPDSTDPTVPVIMITGHTELSNVMEARDAGANEFLSKPVSAKAIYRRIVAIIEHPRMFVTSTLYKGPCRRRYKSPRYNGNERRLYASA